MRSRIKSRREEILFGLSVALILVILGISFAFSGYSAPTDGEWFNTSWNYRIRVEINTTSVNATDWPIEIAVNFSDMVNDSLTFDNNSLRVFEYNVSGKIMYELPSQFDPDIDYNNATNAVGEIVFSMNGTTQPNTRRIFYVYWDYNDSGTKPVKSYSTNLTREWDGRLAKINSTKLDVRINTNGQGNVSGLYYAEDRTTQVPVVVTGAGVSDLPAEYIQFFNGTHNVTFALVGNATFIAGPVRITVVQQGEEVAFGNASNKTGFGRIVKKYHVYNKAGPQNKGSFIKISHEFFPNGTVAQNRSSRAGAIALDVQRTFLSQDLSSSAFDPADPYSWAWATDSGGSVAGVININESALNYTATIETGIGRIGVNLSVTTVQIGSSVKETVLVFFGTGGSDGVSEFLEVRNTSRSPVIRKSNLTEKLLVQIVPSINVTSFNLNETVVIKGNVSSTDPYNLVVVINATLDNGTVTTGDDINMTLFDDATNSDETPGDKIFTNIYNFSLNSNITEWKLNLTAYGNSSQVLNSIIFRFNVTNIYFVNVSITNPIGVINRQVLGNVTIKNFAQTNGISGAGLNCTFNGTSEIFNKTDAGGGIYLFNFTAPSAEGIFNLYCNATKYGNKGNDTEIFQNEPAQTNLTINVTPAAVSVSTVSMKNNNTFSVAANFSNKGNGTGKNVNITVVLLAGWSANVTFETCGNIGVNGSCSRMFNITVPNGTAPGNYIINFTGRWTNPDDTQNFNETFVNVTVLANPMFNITEQNVSGTGADGTLKIVGIFTINSIGNSPAINFTSNCTAGFACSNFNVTFSPPNVSSLPMGSSQAISVVVGIPLNHSAGNFTGTINVTSLAGSQLLPLFILLQNKTNVSVITDPANITVTGVSIFNGANFYFLTNVTNTGNSSARNTNISFVIPANWSINSSFQLCGSMTFNSTCSRSNNVSVPNGTSDGLYTLNVTVNWTHLDNTTESKMYTMNVLVASSPTLDVDNLTLVGNAMMNRTENIFNITVLSVGNSAIVNITFNCTGGVSCVNFTPTFSPPNISSISAASNVTVLINFTIPHMFPAGTYSGTLNVSSGNDGSRLVTLLVTVVANRTWNMTPLSCKRSLNPAEGKVCDVNVSNLGNDIINFTILNITANKTYPNVTTFSVPQYGNYTFSILYNITGFPQEIYNSTYVIAANQSAIPQNFTLNITLLPATPPIITLEVSDSLAEQGLQINITANITDIALQGLSVVNITIARPNGTIDRTNMTLISQSGNFSRWRIIYPNVTTNQTFGNTTGRGIYNISVYAEDNIGNIGNKSENFTIRFKLGIASTTLSQQYVQDDTASIYYSVRDINNTGVQGVNVTFTVLDPNSTLVYRSNITTDSIGTFAPLPTFTLASDAPVGNYLLITNSSYNDTLLNLPFTIQQNYAFAVAAKTITVAGLFADIETAVVWFPNNVMRFNMLIYDGQGTPVDPDNFNLTVLDPAQNIYFSILLNSTTKKGIGYYAYSFAMPASSATGMYLAVLNLTRAQLSTMKLKAFRVAAGGPYDVRLTLAKSEVPQGTPLDFTVVIENKGEVTQDVFVNYTITNAATGTIYYEASEAVLTPAFTNQSFTRSAFIFSTQPLGTYTIRAVVKYDPVQPDINATSTFVVISGRNLTAPPPPSGGGGGPGTVTGVVAGDQPQPVTAIIIEKYSDEIKVYPGFKKIEYVIVRNAGKTALNDISLSILGIPTSWYSISPASYKTMPPDNSTVFLIEYDIPKSAALGDYKFNLIATTSATSDQKSVTIKVLGSVEDLILSEIAALREQLKNLLIDIGVAKSQGKNVNDVLLIVGEVEENIKKAEINYDLGNTQTALDNIKDAKILIEKARDLLSKLVSTRLEGEINPLLILLLALAIATIIAVIVLKKKNAMPKQLSDTVQQFTHIIDKIRTPKNTEADSKEREKLLRMLNVLDKEKQDSMITDSAYNEMKKSVEAKLAKIKR